MDCFRDGVPLPRDAAARAVARCVARSAVLLSRGRVHLDRDRVGLRLWFADGTAARVYRETVLRPEPDPGDRCFLAVRFTLRAVAGRGHVAFERESLLNTPLFVGFPGFVSKLWVAHDEHDRYRGLYEWAGVAPAHHYARSLWRVLELVSVPGSIGYHVLPGVRRDDALLVSRPNGLAGDRPWWRVVDAG